VRLDGATVRQEFARVLEHDHAVAEQAPALFRVRGDDAGGISVDGVGDWTGGLVAAHLDTPRGRSGGYRGFLSACCALSHMTSYARYIYERHISEQVTA
jgi:hypothetical protein